MGGQMGGRWIRVLGRVEWDGGWLRIGECGGRYGYWRNGEWWLTLGLWTFGVWPATTRQHHILTNIERRAELRRHRSSGFAVDTTCLESNTISLMVRARDFNSNENKVI